MAPPAARRALLFLALMVGFLALGPATPASAHAFLERSTPADGAVLADAPAQIELQFSESVLLSATHLDLVDSTGHRYPTTLSLAGEDADGSEGLVVVAALPPLPRSAYRVTWDTLASDDLHSTSGVLVFGVGSGQQVTAVGLSEPLPHPGEAALRWVVFLALALAVGGGVAARLFIGQRPAALDSAARCLRWSIVGSVAGALAAAALLVDQLLNAGSAASRLLLNAYGEHWLLREIGFVVLLAAAVRGSRSLLVLGAAAACIGTALLGHSGSGGGGLEPTRVAADALHLGAAGVWAGTLAVLALVALPLIRAGGSRGLSGRSALRAFGVPAACCVGLMVVTGLYLASDVVGSVDAVLATVYGRTLLLKVILAAVAGALGLNHFLRLRRGPAASSLRGTVVVEVAVAVAILGLAGVLTSAQPAMEPQFIRAPSAATVPVVDRQVADLQESLAIRPNRPGRNVALVAVLDTRRPALSPVSAVDVTFVGSDGRRVSVPAERLGAGQWSAPAELGAGRTQVGITVRRAGLVDAVSSYEWNVAGSSAATRPVTVSNTPVSGILRAASAGVALLLGLGCCGLVLRRRRRTSIADLPAELDIPSPGVDVLS